MVNANKTMTLSLTGYAPTITQPQAVAPGVGSSDIVASRRSSRSAFMLARK